MAANDARLGASDTKCGGSIELEFASDLSVSSDRAWAWITSVEGISKEMAPLLRMTAPKGIESLADLDVQKGERLFRSFLLLFGLVPIDRSDLTLIEWEEGEGFIEQSPMKTMKRWRHERRIHPHSESGVRLVDRLSFEPRLPRAVALPLVRLLFAHRHRMLRKHLGAQSSA